MDFRTRTEMWRGYSTACLVDLWECPVCGRQYHNVELEGAKNCHDYYCDHTRDFVDDRIPDPGEYGDIRVPDPFA